MKLSLLSDLHFEFHKDGGSNFIKNLDSSNVDVLLLAGDIGTLSCLPNAIKAFTDKYPHVIMVAGNHSFWGNNRETVIGTLRELDEKISGFHFLDNDILELDGVRFLGTTLWFRKAHPALAAQWSDFFKIKDFDKWVYEQNDKSIDFLMKNMSKGDVILSHYLPSDKSVSPKFKGDPTNCFYVCDMEMLIEDQKPAVWCHGHTHSSMDYKINDTRVLCNPFGYLNYEENPQFKNKLTFDITK